jgi:hypothetical protein
MKTITREQAAKLIRSIKGNRAFSVEFTKKDGSLRHMNAIIKCTKHLAGGKSTISHKDNLIGCYDMQAGKQDKGKGYRCINIDTLKKVKVGGVEYQVQG